MTYINLVKIADYLGCSLDYLLDRTDNFDSHKSAEIYFDTASKKPKDPKRNIKT